MTSRTNKENGMKTWTVELFKQDETRVTRLERRQECVSEAHALSVAESATREGSYVCAEVYGPAGEYITGYLRGDWTL